MMRISLFRGKPLVQPTPGTLKALTTNTRGKRIYQVKLEPSTLDSLPPDSQVSRLERAVIPVIGEIKGGGEGRGTGVVISPGGIVISVAHFFKHAMEKFRAGITLRDPLQKRSSGEKNQVNLPLELLGKPRNWENRNDFTVFKLPDSHAPYDYVSTTTALPHNGDEAYSIGNDFETNKSSGGNPRKMLMLSEVLINKFDRETMLRKLLDRGSFFRAFLLDVLTENDTSHGWRLIPDGYHEHVEHIVTTQNQFSGMCGSPLFAGENVCGILYDGSDSLNAGLNRFRLWLKYGLYQQKLSGKGLSCFIPFRDIDDFMRNKLGIEIGNVEKSYQPIEMEYA